MDKRNAREHQLEMFGGRGRETAAKAITLWQPWATLVAIGAKQFDTRSWLTRHRGPLVIHAAKRFTRAERAWCCEEPFRSVLRDAGYPEPESLLVTLGKALCVVEVTAMYNTSDLVKGISEQERAFGNYEPGRFAWSLKNLRVFESVSMRGRQGIWTLTPRERVALDAAIATSGEEKDVTES